MRYSLKIGGGRLPRIGWIYRSLERREEKSKTDSGWERPRNPINTLADVKRKARESWGGCSGRSRESHNPGGPLREAREITRDPEIRLRSDTNWNRVLGIIARSTQRGCLGWISRAGPERRWRSLRMASPAEANQRTGTPRMVVISSPK